MTTKPNAMHSAVTVEHYTPKLIVEPARYTLGGVIDLDPASCELANRTVQARRIFTKEDDGLTREWGSVDDPANAFCNPPGGKAGNESIQKLWWKHAAREWQAQRVDALVWVAFKADFIQVTQVDPDDGDPLFGIKPPTIPLDCAICYPRDRIAYLTPVLPAPTEEHPNRKPTARQVRNHAETGLCTGDSPPHASAIIYLPSRRDPNGLQRFAEAFSAIGEVRWDQRYIDMIMRGEVPRRGGGR